MRYRTLGRTGIRVSALAFGAGPVSGLMTGSRGTTRLRWRLCAGRSNSGSTGSTRPPATGRGFPKPTWARRLASSTRGGRPHRHQGPADPEPARRHPRGGPPFRGAEFGPPPRLVRHVLQLHNGLTADRDEEPFSITPADVLASGGVLDAFRDLQADGIIRHLGLTATGQPAAIREVVRSGEFDTTQVPYHLLNPSVRRAMPSGFADTDYGNIIADCAAGHGRVRDPRLRRRGAARPGADAHTLRTPFFPLALYERDRVRARELAADGKSLKENGAFRFVLDDPRVHSAIVGFGTAEHVEELARLGDQSP